MLTSREWICVHTCLRLVFSIVARFYLCIACVSFVRTRFTSIKIISLLNALFYLQAHINWSCIRTRIRKYVKTLYRSNGRRSTQKKYKPIWISSKSFVSFSLCLFSKYWTRTGFHFKEENSHFIKWKINQNCIKRIRFGAQKNHNKQMENGIV